MDQMWLQFKRLSKINHLKNSSKLETYKVYYDLLKSIYTYEKINTLGTTIVVYTKKIKIQIAINMF